MFATAQPQEPLDFHGTRVVTRLRPAAALRTGAVDANRSRLRRSLWLGLLALVPMCGLANEQARANWTAPVLLDSGDVRSDGEPRAAVGPDGTTTLVWGQPAVLLGGIPVRLIQAVRIDPNGVRGPVMTLSNITTLSLQPRVAADPVSGAVMAVWQVPGPNSGFQGAIHGTRIAPDGTPGPPQQLSTDMSTANGDHGFVKVAGASTGGFHVAWIHNGGTMAADGMQTRRIAANGMLGPTLEIPGIEFSRYDFLLAAAPDGGAVIAAPDYSTGGVRNFGSPTMRAVRLAGDGTPGTVHTLLPAGVAVNAVDDVSPPGIGFAGDGTAFVAFRHGLPTSPFQGQPWAVTLQVARLSAAGALLGQFNAGTIANAGQEGVVFGAPVALTAPGGGVTVVWYDPRVTDSDIRSLSFSQAGAPLGPPAVLVTGPAAPSLNPDGTGWATRGPDGLIHMVLSVFNVGDPNGVNGIPNSRDIVAVRVADQGPAGTSHRLGYQTQWFGALVAAGGDVVAASFFTGREETGKIGYALFSPRFPLVPPAGPPPLPPPPPSDSDGDGVPNITDACPTQPGPASNFGCPPGIGRITPTGVVTVFPPAAGQIDRCHLSALFCVTPKPQPLGLTVAVLRARRTGVTMRLSCPQTARGGCTGGAVLLAPPARRGGKVATLGTRSFSVLPGRRRVATVKLNVTGRARLAKVTVLRATLRVSARDASGRSRVITRKVTFPVAR